MLNINDTIVFYDKVGKYLSGRPPYIQIKKELSNALQSSVYVVSDNRMAPIIIKEIELSHIVNDISNEVKKYNGYIVMKSKNANSSPTPIEPRKARPDLRRITTKHRSGNIELPKNIDPQNVGGIIAWLKKRNTK